MLIELIRRLIAGCNRASYRHLEWIYRITSRSPLAITLLSTLLVVVSGFVVASTRFESDIFKLFPSRLPALNLMMDSLKWSGSAKEAYFLLEGDPAQLPGEAQKLVTRLQALQVNSEPAFSRVTWRVYDESEGGLFSDFIAYAAAHPQLFVPESELPRLREYLSPVNFDKSLTRMENELAGQLAGGMSSLYSSDPLFLRELFLPRLKAASQALDLDPASPYFLSRDGKVMIVIAEPAHPVSDMNFARELVKGINQARAGLSVSVTCAGAHISAVIDESEMKGNITSSVSLSLVVVLAIFYFVYRRLLPTILIPVIIGFSVLLSLASASFFLPSMHIISFAFMALIIGLGTDYSIQLYDRFHCERVKGIDLERSLYLTVVETGRGVFTAATTTALPFFAMMVSDVRALYELGLLVGLGVIFSFYATIFFLPPVLIFMERFAKTVYRPLPALGLGAVWRFCARRPRRVILFSLLIIVSGTLATIFGIHFDGELKNLQPRHSEAFLTQEKIERHLSLAPRQMMIAVEGADPRLILQRSAAIGRLIARYHQAGQLSGWSSINSVINEYDQQKAILQGLTAGGVNPGAADLLNGAFVRHGFEPDSFKAFSTALQGFATAAPIAETDGISRLLESPLRAVVNRHLIHDQEGYHSLSYLYYNDNSFDREAFIRELTALDPKARVTAVELVSQQLADSVSSSFGLSFVLGGTLVLMLLLAQFRSYMGIFSSLFPLFTGIIAMLGCLVAFGSGLNFMNSMVLVTLVGMGSDYGMYIYYRSGETDSAAAETNYVQAGRAVLLSALTTIAGFGSLAFADFPALASIGWATNYGIFFTAFFALLTLPAILFYLRSRRDP